MAKWLVIAHDTAVDSELIEVLRQHHRTEEGCSFFLLVPAKTSRHLITSDAREPMEAAYRRASEALHLLQEAGLPVEGARAGQWSPLNAIAEEVFGQTGRYQGLIISTHPPGMSRWLKLDIVHQAQTLTGLPVEHVYPGQRRSTQGNKAPAVQICGHEDVTPLWDGEFNELVHRCTSCGERLPLGSLPERWEVWRP